MSLDKNLQNFSFERYKATAPTLQQWSTLFDEWEAPINPVIDVIVPVYKGYDETSRCLYSVLKEKQHVSFRLVVLNDCSPDKQTAELLEHLSEKGVIELHINKINSGFVKTCNKGMKLHPDRDIVLLNSDTEVFTDWLDRLYKLVMDVPNAGTVTPLSNNAEICNYPYLCVEFPGRFEKGDRALDSLCKQVNHGKYVEIPTGVGFCMYIKRECLDKVGYLDEERFGRGYGEENDLCQRILKAGWSNLLAPNIFVRHFGATSFGAEKLALIENAIKQVNALHPDYERSVHKFIQKDPVKPFRDAIDQARFQRLIKNKAMLFVSHNLGGGTEHHIKELSDQLIAEETPVYICRPVKTHPTQYEITCSAFGFEAKPVTFDSEKEFDLLVDYLRQVKIFHIHIHNLAEALQNAPDFFRSLAQKLNVTMDLTVHDYLPLCPRITFIDQSEIYCGEPSEFECQICINNNGSSAHGTPDIYEWRKTFYELLKASRKNFVPNIDVKNRLLGYWPHLTNIIVRTHQHFSFVDQAENSDIPSFNKDPLIYQIGLIGALGIHKGSALLEKVAIHALERGLPLHFTVIGYTDRDNVLKLLKNVTITGPYQEKELDGKLREHNFDFLWYPAVWPETYSYTLSNAFTSGITPIAFDFGAIAERIYTLKIGETMPIDLILDIEALTQELFESAKKHHGVRNRKMCYELNRNLLQDYYELSTL